MVHKNAFLKSTWKLYKTCSKILFTDINNCNQLIQIAKYFISSTALKGKISWVHLSLLLHFCDCWFAFLRMLFCIFAGARIPQGVFSLARTSWSLSRGPCSCSHCNSITRNTRTLAKDLGLRQPLILTVNPDRATINMKNINDCQAASRKTKLDDILSKIAEDLLKDKTSYPLTIVCTDLQGIRYCCRPLESRLDSDQYLQRCEEAKKCYISTVSQTLHCWNERLHCIRIVQTHPCHQTCACHSSPRNGTRCSCYQEDTPFQVPHKY